MPLISPIYAGLLGLLFVFLSFRVIGGRRAHKISTGDGGEKDMFKRIRVQANCAEYAPIGLILLVLAELQGVMPLIIHALGGALLAGRALHAYGLGSTPQAVPARIWGMYLTVAMITFCALINILLALNNYTPLAI